MGRNKKPDNLKAVRLTTTLSPEANSILREYCKITGEDMGKHLSDLILAQVVEETEPR